MDSAYNSPSLKRVGICICLCVYVIISRLSLTPNICLLDIWHPHRTSCYGTNRGMQQKQPKRKDARILLLLKCAVNVSQKWKYGKILTISGSSGFLPIQHHEIPTFSPRTATFPSIGENDVLSFYPFGKGSKEKHSPLPFQQLHFFSILFHFLQRTLSLILQYKGWIKSKS